ARFESIFIRCLFFFFSSRRRHTRSKRDWSSDVCSSDLGRAIAASTHPLSPRVPTSAGPLPRNHVFAVVGADARSGHVLLRNPVRPEQVLTLDARSFRRGFLSLDVTAPLR